MRLAPPGFERREREGASTFPWRGLTTLEQVAPRAYASKGVFPIRPTPRAMSLSATGSSARPGEEGAGLEDAPRCRRPTIAEEAEHVAAGFAPSPPRWRMVMSPQPASFVPGSPRVTGLSGAQAKPQARTKRELDPRHRATLIAALEAAEAEDEHEQPG